VLSENFKRKIVSEYQAIEQRIENNRRLITTLEETAKAIYRKMFVDDIDPEITGFLDKMSSDDDEEGEEI
jgi:uncharacterized protein YeeX (DUF496 family)